MLAKQKIFCDVISDPNDVITSHSTTLCFNLTFLFYRIIFLEIFTLC